tara:strand:+ start:1357 stop:2361 length:1005 start_codon:yes stop_codon:yes gene_type:complete
MNHYGRIFQKVANRKILVTGAAGFIGFSLCRELLSKKVDIIGIDNFSDYYNPELKRDRHDRLVSDEKINPANFTMHELDLLDDKSLRKITKKFKPDVICHLAAQAGVRYSLENPKSYIDNNIVATTNLLEIAKDYNVNNFILASTSSVYGLNTSVPFSEETPIDSTISPYAASKRACELLCHTYSHIYGLKFRILRFFTVYGPWGRPDMALFKFTKAILSGQPIEVYNDGNMQRDFTFIKDIVSGFISAIDNEYDFEIFNLGFGQTVKLESFISRLEDCLGQKAQKKYLPMQDGDVPFTWSDISKARKMLNYNPDYSTDIGIEKFVKWYIKHYQ